MSPYKSQARRAALRDSLGAASWSGSKLIRKRVRIAFANRSSVRVDGNTFPLSRRATTACVVPMASLTICWVISASALALIRADASANSPSSASNAATYFGSFLHCLKDSSGGNELTLHSISFARLRAAAISRRGVFRRFFSKAWTTTTRFPSAVTYRAWPIRFYPSCASPRADPSRCFTYGSRTRSKP